MPRQSKRYCFTVPCREPNVVLFLKSFKDEHCSYLVYHQERETGPNPDPNHLSHPTCLHGFFTMKKKLSAVHKALKSINFTHLTAAKGTSIEISTRHKKGEYVEFGNPPYQGKRNDIFNRRLTVTPSNPLNAHDKKMQAWSKKKHHSTCRRKPTSIFCAKNLNAHDKQVLEWLKTKQSITHLTMTRLDTNQPSVPPVPQQIS
jgi:hypothetical protein